MGAAIWSTTARWAASATLGSAGKPRSSQNKTRAARRLRAAQRAPLGAARMGRLLGARRTEIGGLAAASPCYQRGRRRRPGRTSGGRLIFTRAAELGKAFLQMLGEQRQTEQIVGSALVASAGRLAAKIAPFLDAGVAPPEPSQGHQVGSLIRVERGDECRKLFVDRIVGLILEHGDHAVINWIGAGIRIGKHVFGLELTRLGDDVANLFGRNR